MSREIALVTDRFPGRPGLDADVSRLVLARVASGDLPETLRLYVPDRLVAFGSRDAVHPRYEEARRAAAGAGFGSYVRLAGGRAAVFHEHTIAFGWAIPTPEPRTTIGDRFDEIASILREAFVALGVDARIGEIPGEYCPGSHSINAGGRVKVAGVGQRLVKGAAHVGGVVVVARPDLVNLALIPVYRALGYEWDPAATGSLADQADVGTGAAIEAISSAFAARHTVRRTGLDPGLPAAAGREPPLLR